MRIKSGLLIVILLLFAVMCKTESDKERYEAVHLKSRINSVQPMTGIVFWQDSPNNNLDINKLEFRYTGYNEIVDENGGYNWEKLERILSKTAERGHQAIIRLYDTFPGRKTTVPESIKSQKGYSEKTTLIEGKKTFFPDWANNNYQDFVIEFIKKFAERYDNDKRIAFLQIGFGLWGEYHIADSRIMKLGETFPDKIFQKRFFEEMNANFHNLYWSISIDSGNDSYGPFDKYSELIGYRFGVFDDSFLCKEHNNVNRKNFEKLDINRYKKNPIGGELSYYTEKDQRYALSEEGPYGIKFEKLANEYHLSYIMGNDQLKYQNPERIKEAGMALGYRFEIVSILSSEKKTKIVIKNSGIAPIYYDTYVSLNGIRSEKNLKYLGNGEEAELIYDFGLIKEAEENTLDNSLLIIECERILPGQIIEYNADL